MRLENIRTRMSLGERIRLAREKIGWSGNKLAIMANLPQSTINRLENNPDSEPGIFTVEAIAKALGLTIDSLLNDDNATPAPPLHKPLDQLANLELFELWQKNHKQMNDELDRREAEVKEQLEEAKLILAEVKQRHEALMAAQKPKKRPEAT